MSYDTEIEQATAQLVAALDRQNQTLTAIATNLEVLTVLLRPSQPPAPKRGV